MLNKLIFLGLVLGLLVGLGALMTESAFLQAVARESAPLGKLFINAIKMVVLPLVMAVIFSSIAKLGDPAKLGKIGGKTLAFYWITLIPAIIIGMGVMTVGLKFTPDINVPKADPHNPGTTIHHGLPHQPDPGQPFRRCRQWGFITSHRLYRLIRGGRWNTRGREENPPHHGGR